MIKFFNDKNTSLDNEAMIYDKENRAENKCFREKWKEMNGKERCRFFKDYMLIPCLLTVCIIGLLSYFVCTAVRDFTVTKYYIACFGVNYMDEESMQEHIKELEEMWELGDHEQVYYTTELNLSGDNKSQLLTVMQSGDIDVLMGDKRQMPQIAELLVDYAEALPKEVYEKIPKDAWVTIEYEYSDENGEKYREEKTAGIDIGSTCWNGDFSAYNGGVSSYLVICVPAASETVNDDSGYFVDFIKYLFEIN